ncbi:hypothetical protein [Vibrio harveyi]|uniref:hypothetical protein n=1 Tax=Vibrio harveyi TaxID=669 RepID=UPI002B3E807C|nr:hypothetical protein [Vibrio harveyi]HEQ3598453.1 hypothetical protein [Vibrio harveyi]HEQ3610131.1 hypothetical protein [Vibrio harveyi]
MAVKGIKQEIEIKQNIDIINAGYFLYKETKPSRGIGRFLNSLTDNPNVFKNKINQYNKHSPDGEQITISEINLFLTKNNTENKIYDLFDIKINNLEKSSRVINWLWGYIQLNFNREAEYLKMTLNSLAFFRKNEGKINQLSNVIISEDVNNYFNNKSNHLENKLEQVINFINYKCLLFDVIDDYLRQLHDKWILVFANKKFEQFITKYKNKDELFKKSQFFYGELIKTDDIEKEIGIFEHCTVNDSTALSQAILDLLNSNLEQQAIISKISKKWSSKKNRHNGRVSFSTTMLPETKNKLDQIVNHSYSNISTTLQKIIDQEHERLFKKSNNSLSKNKII